MISSPQRTRFSGRVTLPRRDMVSTSSDNNVDYKRMTAATDLDAQTASAREVMRPALNRLAEFAHFPHDWDSYGGETPTATAIEKASDLLVIVAEWLGTSVGPRVQPDLVAPLPDGGIHLRWRGQTGEVQVEFSPAGIPGYLYITRRNGEETYSEEAEAPWATVIRLIKEVVLH